jgi:hypothetical protein
MTASEPETGDRQESTEYQDPRHPGAVAFDQTNVGGHWWDYFDHEAPEWYEEHGFDYEPQATLQSLSEKHRPDVPEEVHWSKYVHYICSDGDCRDRCINPRESRYAMFSLCRHCYQETDLTDLNPAFIEALPAEHRPDLPDDLEWSEYEHYECRRCPPGKRLCINHGDSIYARSRLCRLCFYKKQFYSVDDEKPWQGGGEPPATDQPAHQTISVGDRDRPDRAGRPAGRGSGGP